MVLSTTKLCCTSYIKAMLPTSYNKLCFSSFRCSNSANVLVIWVISKPSPNCVHENPDVSHEYLFWVCWSGVVQKWGTPPNLQWSWETWWEPLMRIGGCPMYRTTRAMSEIRPLGIPRAFLLSMFEVNKYNYILALCWKLSMKHLQWSFYHGESPARPTFRSTIDWIAQTLWSGWAAEREEQWESLVIQSWMDFNDDPMKSYNQLVIQVVFKDSMGFQWTFRHTLFEFMGSSWEQGLGWWISSANLGIWSYLINKKSGLNHQERESAKKAQINVTNKKRNLDV